MSTGRPWRSEGLLAFHPVLNHRVKRRWSWAEAEGCGGSSGITQGLGGVGCTLRPRYYSYSTPVPPPPARCLTVVAKSLCLAGLGLLTTCESSSRENVGTEGEPCFPLHLGCPTKSKGLCGG